jgi:hypothetical protein
VLTRDMRQIEEWMMPRVRLSKIVEQPEQRPALPSSGA